MTSNYLQALVAALLLGLPSLMRAAEPLELIQKFELNGPAGRMDHFAVDSAGRRLFVSNRGANSLDVVDLKTGSLAKRIAGQNKIRGIAYLPKQNRIFVGNGQPGECNAFDGSSYQLLKSLPIANADNVQFDPRHDLIFVGHDGLTAIDPKSLTIKRNLDLGGTLKAFRVDPDHDKLYANVTTTEVVVVDTGKLEIAARYPVTAASGNASMALDAAHRRLFIGCRKEPKLVVLDADNGKEIANLEIPGEVDDLSFDAKRGRIYASCGVGVVAVVEQQDPNKYAMSAKITSSSKASTSLFDSQAGRFYVGVPQPTGPEVWVYEARP